VLEVLCMLDLSFRANNSNCVAFSFCSLDMFTLIGGEGCHRSILALFCCSGLSTWSYFGMHHANQCSGISLYKFQVCLLDAVPSLLMATSLPVQAKILSLCSEMELLVTGLELSKDTK
jgi:hypothetical protein